MTTHPHPTHPTSPPPPGRHHSYRSVWIGDALDCGASCTCGVTFDGFATIGEATALLDEHIADSLPTPTSGHLPIAAADAFRVNDLVSVDGDRPGRSPWRITRIVTNNPAHDGPYAELVDLEDGGASWAALRILRPANRSDYEWNFTPPPARTPRLGDVVRDAQLLAARLVAVLSRQYDPESAPVGALGEPDVELSDAHLGRAISQVRVAVAELGAITAKPARACGPYCCCAKCESAAYGDFTPDHPPVSGEGPPPGLAVHGQPGVGAPCCPSAFLVGGARAAKAPDGARTPSGAGANDQTPDRRDPALAGAVATPGVPVGASRARSGGPGTDSRLRVSTSPYLVYTAGAYSTEASGAA